VILQITGVRGKYRSTHKNRSIKAANDEAGQVAEHENSSSFGFDIIDAFYDTRLFRIQQE
jgi:hypothetical protein